MVCFILSRGYISKAVWRWECGEAHTGTGPLRSHFPVQAKSCTENWSDQLQSILKTEEIQHEEIESEMAPGF